jgi:transposase
MASLPAGPEAAHVGMDPSMREIVCGVLRPGREVPAVERIPNDGESVRRLIGKPGDRRRLSVCHEAGPSGHELRRLLASMGAACEAIAPSLAPKGASDRVKTDRRDAVRLALALRAGMPTPVRVPSTAEEAVRDMVRARGGLLDDRKRMRQRLSALLLRHGRAWGGGSKWTPTHPACGRAGGGSKSPRSRRPWTPTAAPSGPGRPGCARPRPGCRPGQGAIRSRPRWPGWAPAAGSRT